ncbi:hypothetical protein KFL_000750190 [Klebsormidium nitens]|uniref:Uncharacterized protein n=1 Tax=Klebsormidium nitens TaxID=105231 RepID=A0A0U9HMZ2_KLENI|nr:hypothetical protein KFL_000750190 [Klebsormidium nitens]|eukprot:GAQ81251.1 hypothetical protein KFL_000750190 [Klebsormidium nitens]
MAAQRISAALLRWNAARVSILKCVQLEHISAPLSQVSFGQHSLETRENQLRCGGAQNGASDAVKDSLQDGDTVLPSDKSTASFDKRTSSDDKVTEPLRHREVKAGDRVTSAVWMRETKKRNKVLEPAVEKIIAVHGEEKLHKLFEDLQAKWRMNGASACGRMIYCLRRLIDMKDVDRTLLLMRWLSERSHYKDSRKLRVTRGRVGEMLQTLGLPVPPDCVYVRPAKKPSKPTWFIEGPPLHERIKNAPREPHWTVRGQG